MNLVAQNAVVNQLVERYREKQKKRAEAWKKLAVLQREIIEKLEEVRNLPRLTEEQVQEAGLRLEAEYLDTEVELDDLREKIQVAQAGVRSLGDYD